MTFTLLPLPQCITPIILQCLLQAPHPCASSPIPLPSMLNLPAHAGGSTRRSWGVLHCCLFNGGCNGALRLLLDGLPPELQVGACALTHWNKRTWPPRCLCA